MTEVVPGLEALCDQFDAFLVDQFGVLIGGDGAYPWAAPALERLATTGKPIVLLSNSGRRSAPNVDRLVGLGFARDSFLTVVSSGEAAYAELLRRVGTQIAAGARVLVLSREHDMSGIEGLDLSPTEDPADAELILLAGSCGDAVSLDQYADMLRNPARRGVPCLCTNPDMKMLSGHGVTFGAGRIAQLYETLGGRVDWVGKPYPLIYDVAARLLPGLSAARVLCLGDSPAHDVRGGQGAGFATALVRTGIHTDLSESALAALCAEEKAVPDFILPRFEYSV